MKIVAGILAYREHPRMIEEAAASAADLDGCLVFGEQVEIEDELGEAAARQVGLTWAQEQEADWYLQLDADERLVNGADLYDYLELADGRDWWPLPYVQEGGWTTVAPCKLIRPAGAECVLASDVYRFGGGPATLLSGYTFPEDAVRLLARLPHLLHLPGLRPDAAERRRLSAAIEGSDQAGRVGAVKPELAWVIPPARRLG